jgi:hypothetical protein
MAVSGQIFDVVKTLYSQRPFRIASVSAAVGMPLRLDSSASNRYFQMYKGAGHSSGLFTEVEVRIPTRFASVKDGIVILSVNTADSCVKMDEVMDQFGKNPEPYQPSPNPRGPATEVPFSLVYRLDWGLLSFEFPQQGGECLLSIAVNATGS